MPKLSDSDPEKWKYDLHTRIKHEILMRYLSPWTTILGKAADSLAIVDAIAGKGRYNQNEAGPTKEERESAQAQVVLADAALADLEAKLAKTKLFAPADGTIGVLAAEPGEVISPGQSVMTLAAKGERWFTFTVREDFLKGVTVGSHMQLLTANGKTVEARVTELRPLGEFATWRAARAVGDYDLNSFLVRADPDKTTEELHPGMTVWLDPSAQAYSK